MIANKVDRDRRGPRRVAPPDEASTARRLAWVVLGALAYTLANFAAKYVFGL